MQPGLFQCFEDVQVSIWFLAETPENYIYTSHSICMVVTHCSDSVLPCQLKSSTSNMSVAFGGMVGGDPLAP